MSTKPTTYKAVIIGAGRIASTFDSPSSKNVLTHARALTAHSRVKLVGMTDTNGVHGKKEAKKWRTNFYADRETMIHATTPDIVVIATPDKTHLSILLYLMKKNIPLIICEKPVVTNALDIARVKRVTTQSKSMVLVNFRRRFDPTIVKLRRDIITKKFGAVISANAIYSKGILHNGAHFIDLARYLFGEMRMSNMVFRVNDFPEGAPSVGGVATFDRCPQFYLMNGDERQFSLAEFEIVTAKRRFRLVDEGFKLVTEEVVPDPIFKGYHMLGNEKTVQTGLIHSMPGLVSNAVGVLDKKQTPQSSLHDALKTHETCFTLLKSYSKK